MQGSILLRMFFSNSDGGRWNYADGLEELAEIKYGRVTQKS
jgi:hypothetical protein